MQDNVRKRNQGYLLLSVTLAMGVTLIIILGLFSLLSQHVSETRSLKERIAAQDFQLSLARAFSDGTLCTWLLTQPTAATFDSTNATTGNPNAPSIPLTTSTIPVTTAPGAPALITAGLAISPSAPTLIPTGPFTINNIAGSTSGSYGLFQGTFRVNFDATQSAQPIHPAEVTLSLSTSAVGTTQTITACQRLVGFDSYSVDIVALPNFNTLCTGVMPMPAGEFMACISACDRYCSTGCAPTLANCPSTPTAGLNYSGGTITEWSAITGQVTCTCIR
ncbi:MAG: hypothetical protein C5B49_11235 [Bdellovibrio sp.]|nr:MAG: hypothetical protein C5B49_11235 [Bdellovibrio sp.]